MRVELVTAPATEPVDLTTAKLHLRVSISTDDALITSLIVAARAALEAYTRRAFITQTHRLWLDEWPSARRDVWWDGTREGALAELYAPTALQLPYGPALAVASVTTYDDADAATVLSSATYYLDTAGGRVVPRAGFAVPAGTRVANAIAVQWSCGWASAAVMPEPLKQAVLQTVASLYESRGEPSGATTATAALLTLPAVARALADPWRVYAGALG